MKKPFRAYLLGFILSLLLTLSAYQLVEHHIRSHHISPSDDVSVFVLLVLALIQFFVQMVLFLHLGREKKPRWNLMAFGFMTTVVLILVLGSLWIMNHLNYHMMSPQQTNTYIINDEGFGHSH